MRTEEWHYLERLARFLHIYGRSAGAESPRQPVKLFCSCVPPHLGGLLTISEHVALMPHAVCWAAAPTLVWTMVITNLITFLSYVSICLTLLYLARRTGRVIARDWAYFVVGFALFIVACGSTHALEVVTTWCRSSG